MPRKPKLIPVEVQYRSLSISEAELDLLLLLAQKVTLPTGLLKQMDDLKTDFENYILKLKEQIAQAKAISFYVDGHREVSEEDRQNLKEIASIPAHKLRALLKRKDREDAKKLQTRNPGQNHRPSNGKVIP